MAQSHALKLIAFDAYGTLFDVMSVAQRLEQHFPAQGQSIARLLREKQVEYSRLRALAGPQHYKPFWDLTRDALVYTLAAGGHRATDSVLSDVLSAYREIRAYPEVMEVLQSMQRSGLRLVVLSNGNPDMLDDALRSAGLGAYFQAVLSAESVRSFKVRPEVYALATQFAECHPTEVLLVSSNAWDIAGAHWAGLRGFWVNRAAQPFEQLDLVPDGQGSDLRDLLPFLSSVTLDSGASC
ncbi:MAG: putative hydrolase superfamily [Pseudomonadota bacterium]|jgi:2-haloacid dehalogenase